MKTTATAIATNVRKTKNSQMLNLLFFYNKKKYPTKIFLAIDLRNQMFLTQFSDSDRDSL